MPRTAASQIHGRLVSIVAPYTCNMGGPIGMALLGAIYASQLHSTLGDTVSASEEAPNASDMTPEALRKLTEPSQELFQQAG